MNMKKKKYVIPCIRIQSIESDNIMEMSLAINNNPDDSQITDGSEILINKHSVWDSESEE